MRRMAYEDYFRAENFGNTYLSTWILELAQLDQLGLSINHAISFSRQSSQGFALTKFIADGMAMCLDGLYTCMTSNVV
jgi:hypothetical protein